LESGYNARVDALVKGIVAAIDVATGQSEAMAPAMSIDLRFIFIANSPGY
jgi:hypothetical protein